MKTDIFEKKSNIFSVLVSFLIVLIVVLLCLCTTVLCAGRNVLENGRFPQGTHIAQLDLSGMTYSEGQDALLNYCEQTYGTMTITMDISGEKESFPLADLLDYQVESALDPLFYDRSHFALADYLNAVLFPPEQASGELSLVFDRKAIAAALANRIGTRGQAVAKNASFSFSGKNGDLYFEEEVVGKTLNPEKTADALIAALSAETPVGEFQVVYDETFPDITVATLQENMHLVSQYTTKFSANPQRNTNIRLMCQALNGYELKPGETLSINGLVGQRTKEKGFQPAPSIVGGELVDELGGGICQVSGTLYNAALLADMEIVERLRHTYPANYLPIGLDATLNWNDKDLKIKNTTEHSIYIHAGMDEKALTLTVKLYGEPFAEGETIEIVPEILRTKKPGNPEITYTPSLPAGKKKVISSGRTGYEVIVYRKHYLNGELVSTETISHDTYPATPKKIQIGSSSNTK